MPTIQLQHHLNIANTLLNIPREEKEALEIPKDGQGPYHGFAPQSYRPATIYEDNVEHYNFSRFTSDFEDDGKSSPKLPPSLDPYLPDLKSMSVYIHKVLARKILTLLAIALEVDEATLTNMHTYDSESGSFMRYMQYTPLSKQADLQSQELYLPGHSDWGSLTFLFNQTVWALQIRETNPDADAEHSWKWVQYVPNSIVVNVGVALAALTGGYLNPVIHRVVRPPADQASYPRIYLLYFLRPYDTHSLSMVESPVLEKEGCESTLTITMGEYVRVGKTGAFRVNYDSDKVSAKTRMFR